MKTGKTLQELAAEITRQAETKKDYVASTGAIEMLSVGLGDRVELRLADKGRFPVNQVAHDQIAEHVKIPKPYYERMRNEAPDLLATNVQRWFEKYPARRLVRTLDGGARAFLSDKFPTDLDNIDFAQALLPVVADRKLNVMSCELTEKRLYIKAVDERLYRDVPVGYRMGDGSHRIFDTCAPVLILSNSEVGFGRMVVETGVYTRACTNLALWSDGGMKRTHVGARHQLTDGADVEHLLTSATKRKTMEALWLQARDVIAAAFDEGHFRRRAEQLAATAENKITGKVTEVVQLASMKFGLNNAEQENVLQHLIEGGQLSQYGLHAAVTRSAQDAKDYDRATELEYVGGQILELPKTDWARLAEAA